MNRDAVMYQLGVKPGFGDGFDGRNGIGITHDHVEVVGRLPLEAQGLEAAFIIREGSMNSGCWRHGLWSWVGGRRGVMSIDAIGMSAWCWSRMRIGMGSGWRAIGSGGVGVWRAV